MAGNYRFICKIKGANEAPALFLEHVGRAFRKTLERSRSKAIKVAPKKTGRLKGEKGGGAGITYRVEETPSKLTGILSSTALNPTTGIDYSILRSRGTGVFGPSGKPIKPIRAKMLVWLKDGNPNPTTPEGWRIEEKIHNVARAKQVKGTEGIPFLEIGIKEGLKHFQSDFKKEMDAFNKAVQQ